MRAPFERRIIARAAGTPVTREFSFSGTAVQVRL
jgi:hypothetical protein